MNRGKFIPMGADISRIVPWNVMTMKTRISLILLILLPLWAEAAVWSTVTSNKKMRVEIDLASFMRRGNVVTVWDREVYFAPEQAQPGDFYFKSAKSLVRYNCDTRTADLLMKVYYADDGSEIRTLAANDYGRPNYVVPDTEAEEKLDYACKYSKAPEKKAVETASKKDEKKEDAGKTAEPPAKKAVPAALATGAKAKLSPEPPPKAPPKPLPVLKPSGVPAKPVAGTGKGAT